MLIYSLIIIKLYMNFTYGIITVIMGIILSILGSLLSSAQMHSRYKIEHNRVGLINICNSLDPFKKAPCEIYSTVSESGCFSPLIPVINYTLILWNSLTADIVCKLHNITNCVQLVMLLIYMVLL